MWIEDKLEKWKRIKTNFFDKQMENIFFPLGSFHMILIQELLSGMHFLKILSKTFLFLLLSRVREVFVRTVLHLSFLFLQSLMPVIIHSFYYSFFSCSLLNMCLYVCTCTNLYTVYLYHHCHSGLYHICFFFCAVERKTGQEN